jgi:DNA processing protein
MWVTQYAKNVTQVILEVLCKTDTIIVSSLSSEIDIFIQEFSCSLAIPAICVLGHGFDYLKYDRYLQKLARKIIRRGNKIISPFESKRAPSKQTYEYKDKILAEMCDFIVVVQDAPEGNSVLLAEEALNLGKQVFVLGGDIFSYLSRGPNTLLSKGAKLLISPSELADFCNL